MIKYGIKNIEKDMYEVLKIEKDTKTKAIESLRTMLPYVIDTAAINAMFHTAFMDKELMDVAGFVIIPLYCVSLTSLYGITSLCQFIKSSSEDKKMVIKKHYINN